jgi:hypothetical protein
VPPPRFDGRPGRVAPARPRRFGALASAPRGRLETPAERLAHATARGEMGGNTPGEANHRGDAAPGPALAPEARGFGAWLSQCREVGALLGGQPGRGTRRGPLAQRLRSSVAGTCSPLADGSCAAPQGLGDLARGPALLVEVPGLEPSGCAPVVG